MKNKSSLLLILLISLLSIEDMKAIQQDKALWDQYKTAIALSEKHPDSAIIILKENIIAHSDCGDTLRMYTYNHLGRLQGLRQNYSEAFDYLEQAMRLAETLRDSFVLAISAQNLGNLYTEFGKEEIARKMLKRSLSINNLLFSNGTGSSNRVTGAHFHLAMHYRAFSHLNLALVHLDSCEVIGKRNNHVRIYDNYHRAEQAAIYCDLGMVDTSIIILHQLEKLVRTNLNNPKVQDHVKGHLTLVYYYLGNAYLKKSEYTECILYYHKALEINDCYGLYNNEQNKILEKLAYAEFRIQGYKQAYTDLLKSKKLGDEMYSVASLKNSSLIEIKSKYQNEIEEQRLALLEQQNIMAEQRQSIMMFQTILIILIALMVIVVLLWRMRKQKARLVKEKKQHEQKQKEQSDSLETKNKELTTYTLKLIHNEQTIDELLVKLKEGKTDATSVESIEKQIKASSTALWDEFNTRFVEVNSDFYQRLQQKYPDLSQTERKHCALIRLNFSGKEMAHLLGINVTSVHVSRYRLRKRFGLAKDQNLSDFIAGV